MGAIELKEYIKMQLENADERVLRIVASVFDNYSMENVVSLDIEKFEIAKDDYLLMVEEGFEDIKNGNILSNEEMKLKIEELKNRK